MTREWYMVLKWSVLVLIFMLRERGNLSHNSRCRRLTMYTTYREQKGRSRWDENGCFDWAYLVSSPEDTEDRRLTQTGSSQDRSLVSYHPTDKSREEDPNPPTESSVSSEEGLRKGRKVQRSGTWEGKTGSYYSQDDDDRTSTSSMTRRRNPSDMDMNRGVL